MSDVIDDPKQLDLHAMLFKEQMNLPKDLDELATAKVLRVVKYSELDVRVENEQDFKVRLV